MIRCVFLLLAGHVHSYERVSGVYNNTLDTCGPVYMNIGDGGNYEGVYTKWRTAPDWTAFREASFGVAKLVVENATHAKYSWNRHACQSDSPGYPDYNMNFSESCVTYGDSAAQAMLTTDETWLVRPDAIKCTNRYRSTAAVSNGDTEASSDSNSNSSLPSLEVALAVLTTLFGLSTVVLAAMLFGSKASESRSADVLSSSLLKQNSLSNVV
jgi:hypothetical protein